MPDVLKIYWSLRALGRQADADRLRGDWVAARCGAAAAMQRLERTAEEMRGALAALGSSREAHALREAALARCGRGAGPASDGLRERTPRLLPAADPLCAPAALSHRGDAASRPDAATALRRKLAAARESDRARRRTLQFRKRVRVAVVAAALLACGAAVSALAVARRDALGAGRTKARDGAASERAGTRLPPPAPVTQPLPAAVPPPPAARVRVRGRDAAQRTDATPRVRVTPEARVADATAASGAGDPQQARILFLDLGAGEFRPVPQAVAPTPALTPAARQDAEPPAAP